MYRFLIFALLGAAFLLHLSLAHGQDQFSSREEARIFTLAQIQKVAQQLGIPEDSDVYRNMLREMESPDEPEADTDEVEPHSIPVLPVTRHLKVEGESGITFKVKAANERPAIPDDLMQDVMQNAQDISSRYEQMATPPKSIPRCTQSRSTRVLVASLKGLPPNTPLMDKLYIQKSEAPEDIEQLLGKFVQVLRYEQDPNNLVYQQMLGSGVNCLPSRVRITAKFKIIEEGLNALRNYDRDPNGIGIAVPFFKDYRL